MLFWSACAGIYIYCCGRKKNSGLDVKAKIKEFRRGDAKLIGSKQP